MCQVTLMGLLLIPNSFQSPLSVAGGLLDSASLFWLRLVHNSIDICYTNTYTASHSGDVIKGSRYLLLAGRRI